MVEKIVLVPARGGSKRLKNKNIKTLIDRPLIYYTLDVVVDMFDEVIVPTDSDEIFQIVKEHSNKVIPIKRPKELATDTSKVLETVNWFFLENNLQNKNGQIWMCLPTCPLRNSSDIKKAKKMLTKKADGVIGITDFDFPPILGFNMDEENFITDYHSSKPFQNGNTRSQDHEKIYRPNGAFYGMWYESFYKYKSFYKGNIKGCYMPRERSLDIDTELDFKIIEQVIISKLEATD